MERYQETSETWNKIASFYEDQFMDLSLYNETYDFVCNSLTQPNGRILEIGCGPGNITKYILSKRPDLKIDGIDIAPNMVALAKKNNPTASFRVMDCRQISEIAIPYDAIICGFCIPYLLPEDCKKFIADAYSLLNANGLLYISFVEGDPDQSNFQTGSTGDRIYFHFYNLDKVRELLIKNKFQELEIFKVYYEKPNKEKDAHTIVTARKKD